jgi:hypothetical protein
MGCVGERILVEREELLACKGSINVLMGLEKVVETERCSSKFYTFQCGRWQ